MGFKCQYGHLYAIFFYDARGGRNVAGNSNDFNDFNYIQEMLKSGKFLSVYFCTVRTFNDFNYIQEMLNDFNDIHEMLNDFNYIQEMLNDFNYIQEIFKSGKFLSVYFCEGKTQ